MFEVNFKRAKTGKFLKICKSSIMKIKETNLKEWGSQLGTLLHHYI